MHTSFSLTKPSLMWAVSGSGSLSRPCRHRAQPISAVAAPSKPIKYQTTHSMPMEKIELFRSLEGWATDNLLPMLKPVDQCWQPQTFLPNAASMPKDEFHDRVQELRDRAAHLSDECILMLLGSMITEDALPTYQSMVNRLDGVKDETGASTSPWATWIRCWTAEENRHGDLLHTYLYLTGRVDMFMVQRTIQYLIGAGMDPGFENNPYLGFVYTSFQERATFISHGNIARMVKEGGDPVLARICGTIAADEKRHENAYLKIVDKLLEVDPNDSVLAIGKMLRKNIEMPAHLMTDPNDPSLFKRLEAMTQHLGIYTLWDYADIIEFLIDRWGLEKIEGLSPEAREAQEFVCRLAPRVRRLQELADYRNKKLPPRQLKFSWLFNKEVTLNY